MSSDKVVNIKPTTLAQLKKLQGGEVVELPGFVSDEPFYCRLTQPSMMLLAKTGAIPNSLLSRAGDLFTHGSKSMDADNDSLLSEMYDVMHVICEAAMVEPTLADVEGLGMHLTDAQMSAIFAYTQRGINKLTQFRGQQASPKLDLNLA